MSGNQLLCHLFVTLSLLNTMCGWLCPSLRLQPAYLFLYQSPALGVLEVLGQCQILLLLGAEGQIIHVFVYSPVQHIL